MRTYELMATPLVYPGQTVRARVIADPRNAGRVSVGLRALVYGANDALSPLDGEPVVLSPGAETVLDMAFARYGRTANPVDRPRPSFDGAAADGAVTLDYLRWDGPPDVRLRRPDAPGEFWRRAWVNAVSVFSTSFPQAFRISQDRGEGMIIHGGRQWTDYRVETALTVHLAEYAGVGVRVQGLRRYYAVLLVRPDRLRLVRVLDGAVNVLAESSFAWSFETPYAFAVQVCGADDRGFGRRRSAAGARRKPVRARGRRRRVDHSGRRMLVRRAARRAAAQRRRTHWTRRDRPASRPRLWRLCNGWRQDRERRKVLRLGQGHSQCGHRGRGWRVRRSRRSLGLREIDAAAHDRWP